MAKKHVRPQIRAGGKPASKHGEGLHELPSGLYHTADSLAGGRRGMFVDRFGPPGDPTIKPAIAGDGGGMELGTTPRILQIQQQKKQRNID